MAGYITEASASSSEKIKLEQTANWGVLSLQKCEEWKLRETEIFVGYLEPSDANYICVAELLGVSERHFKLSKKLDDLRIPVCIQCCAGIAFFITLLKAKNEKIVKQ